VGADPLVVLFDNPGWGYIGLPVAVGRLMLVMIAWLYHDYRRASSIPHRSKSNHQQLEDVTMAKIEI
jgi:CBS-domain-containing membrane protein